MNMKKKLTAEQWNQLDYQYQQTPAINESFAASGEHYILTSLLREFGYFVHSREEAMDVAERLLAEGWSD
jgi:hypothetical protein